MKIVHFDIGSTQVELLAVRTNEIFNGASLGDALSALCLSVCFMISHIEHPDDKQAVYEEFIREMAKVMAVAPGVKK